MSNVPEIHNAPFPECRAHISSGRLSIPAQFRKAIKLKDGDEVILSLKDGVIQIKPLSQIIEEVQEIVSRYFAGDDLVEELMIMRSQDIKRESERMRE